jgi:hypothetical protein
VRAPALMMTGMLTKQQALVRLCLDARMRARFLATGELDGIELTAAERSELASIPRAALERFAGSLVAKRWGEVSRVVPLTLRVSPRLGHRYQLWLATSPSPARDSVLDPGCAEALRALPALCDALAGDAGEAAYAPDLLMFEVLARCSRCDRQPRNGRARYAVHEIADALARAVIPMDPEPVPTRFRFEAGGVRWWTEA